MGVQIYCGVRMPSLLTPEELEDMLDFADIGGVYNSSGAAAANTTALQGFLSSRTGSDGIQLAFTGPRLSAQYNDKRQAGLAYLDLSGGPITYYPPTDDAGNIQLLGLAGSKIIGWQAATAITPIFEIQRDLGGTQAFQFSNLEFQNGLGSGIKFWANPGTSTGPGARCIFDSCFWRNIGTSLGSPPAIAYDDWTDLDTAVYGLWFEEADGCHLYNCAINGVSGHGLIAKRWHEGVCHLSVRECLGAGLKGQEVNGTSLQLRSESNQGWGFHVRDTGTNRYEGGVMQADDAGTANAWDVWTEANNGRGATDPLTISTGYRYRQNRIDGCSRITCGGHSGWSSNKFQIDEGSRRSCRLIESDWIDPSVDGVHAFLVYDMNSHGTEAIGGSADNWTTAWPSVGDRPTVAELGSTGTGDYEVQIDFPGGSFDDAAVDAWWLPIPTTVTVPNVVAGDTWMMSMEVSTDSSGASYCTSREALAVPQRMQSYLGGFSIRPMDQGSTTYALWNTAKRKLSSRVYSAQAAGAGGITLNTFFEGMNDVGGSGSQYPVTPVQLNIHSIKLYRVPA